MDKPFDRWNRKKKLINQKSERPLFNEREIWMCVLGINVGSEQDGSGSEFLRPIMIIKKFDDRTLWSVPLSKKRKTGNYFYSFSFRKDIISTAVLLQLRLVDSFRLEYKLGTASEKDFQKIKHSLRRLLS
jgi:mRNA-degrading endonuclease toxin of MazEF toxin-antitoxin module